MNKGHLQKAAHGCQHQQSGAKTAQQLQKANYHPFHIQLMLKQHWFQPYILGHGMVFYFSHNVLYSSMKFRTFHILRRNFPEHGIFSTKIETVPDKLNLLPYSGHSCKVRHSGSQAKSSLDLITKWSPKGLHEPLIQHTPADMVI